MRDCVAVQLAPAGERDLRQLPHRRCRRACQQHPAVPFLAAQRRALAQLSVLGIDWAVHNGAGPIGPRLLFTYRSTEAGDAATIGHLDGLITLDLDEADPAQREQIRHDLGEQYRTPLGHIRHELGHYVWQRYVANDPARLRRVPRRVRRRDRRLRRGARTPTTPAGDDGSWRDDHVSFYAAAHPWEDYAESWAQVMHVHDVVSTGSAWGVVDSPASTVRPGAVDVDGGAGHPRRQRAGAGDGHARPVPVRPVAGCPAQDRGGVASDTPDRFSLTRRPTSGIVAGPDPPADNHCENPAAAVAGDKGEHMRSRSRVRSLFVPLAIVGVLGRRERRQCRHGHHDPRRHRRRGHRARRHRTQRAATDRTARRRRAGAGSGADSGIEGADLAGTDGDDAQRRDLRGRSRRDAGRRAQRVRRRQRDDDHLRRAPGRSRTTSERWSAAAARPTSPCSRSRAFARLVRAERRCPAASRRRRRQRERELARRLDELRQRRRHAVRRADRSPTSSRSCGTCRRLRREGLRGPDDARRLLRPHRADDRQRRHPAVRRHRGRVRRPAGRSPTGSRSSILRNQGIDFYNQWVAHEIPFNSPEVVDTMQQVVDLWNTEGMVYAAGGSIVAHGDFRRQRRTAGRRRLHDAPPGQLLRPPSSPNAAASFGDGGRPGRHVLLPGQRGPADARRRHRSPPRSATHPRCGP